MKKIVTTIISTLAALSLLVIFSGFTNTYRTDQSTPPIYEFEIVTVVESLIQNGLGRSRMISKTENTNYREATTIRREDGEKQKSNKKRSEIRTKAFEETKLLNFYNVGGIRFNNIATNDAMVRSKLNEMSTQGWELFSVASGVESADKERDAIFISRYIFRKEK